ncbi:MAG TPA: extensin family protein, partial [Phenylobacterium sp.]|nr:extensin family protein [Phenylobacterium sp.]
LEDGRGINVKTHWGTGGKEGEFLKRVHKGGCRLFSVTLGPDYNAAHADHLHLDFGRFRLCR